MYLKLRELYFILTRENYPIRIKGRILIFRDERLARRFTDFHLEIIGVEVTPISGQKLLESTAPQLLVENERGTRCREIIGYDN